VKTAQIFLKFADDSCTPDGWISDKPLIHAASEGGVELVRVLLEEGANVYNTYFVMCASLCSTVLNRHLKVCRLLLD
jgi:ankyrin repeat protein